MERHIGVKIHLTEFTFRNIREKAYVKFFEGDVIRWDDWNFEPHKFYALIKKYKNDNTEMYNFIFEENVEYLI